MFEPDAGSDGSTTLGGLYRTCSYGQSMLTRNNSWVAPIVKLPCAGTSSWGTPYRSQSCDYADFVGWSEAAMDQLRAQGINPDAYTYKCAGWRQLTVATWLAVL